MEDIEYIQPNEIGYLEISEHERKVILKSEQISSNNLIVVLISFIVLIVGILMIKTDLETNGTIGEAAFEYTGIGIIWLTMLLSSKTKLEYTASAYGTVVRKDIITQRVFAGKKYRYKRYIAEPMQTDSPTVEQDFYYLTLKLADGRYVRYVNCLREDFISVSEGYSVLAVCYGFNEIKGYVI